MELVNGAEGDPVRTVSSRLRLRHVNLGCYLHSHSKQLPKWWADLSMAFTVYSYLSGYAMHMWLDMWLDMWHVCTCRGWEQLEVTCNPRQRDKSNIWNVEGNVHDKRKRLYSSYMAGSWSVWGIWGICPGVYGVYGSWGEQVCLSILVPLNFELWLCWLLITLINNTNKNYVIIMVELSLKGVSTL